MVIFIFFICSWYLSLFSQTFLMHRYASHGSFTMSRFWEKFFYIFAYLTMGSSYLSPRAYGILHRMHHAYADTEKDPHSPKYFKDIFAMMRHTAKVYSAINRNKVTVEKRFRKKLPSWKALDIWGQSTTSRLLWVSIYLNFFV